MSCTHPRWVGQVGRFGREVLTTGRSWLGAVRTRPLRSCVCTEHQLNSFALRRWARRFRDKFQLHRKLWEWCYISQALHERDTLRWGKRGLGFAVGAEPLTALFASLGCEVVATDLDPTTAAGYQTDWLTSGQHAANKGLLNARGICDPEAFDARVELRYVDMNHIPADLTGFDFVWSSCSFEHLGTIELGKRFVENMTRCLRPGGVAVHTTEFNVLSDAATLESGPNVIFRRRDIEEMAARVGALGCRLVERDYSLGGSLADWSVDVAPYSFQPHLKLEHEGYVMTSIGIIVEKPA